MIQFNAAANYFRTPLTVAPNCEAAKTIFCRLNIASLTTPATQGIFNATNTTSIAYQIGIRANTLCLWNYGGGVVISTVPATGVWLNFAYTYNPTGTTSTLYVDGVLVATATVAVNTGAVTETQIGGNQWGENTSVLMEDLRIYNRVLTTNEIISIGNAQGRDAIVNGLTYWWKMDGGIDGAAMIGSDLKECYGAVSTLVGTGTAPTARYSNLMQRQPM